MDDFDVVRAYKKVYDEDGTMEDIVAHKAGCRLLKSVVVQKVMDDYDCKYLATKQADKERTLARLDRIFVCAMRDRDYAAANSAIDKLMKHLGMYDKHQKQKRYSADELVGIRQKLAAQGVQFEELNRPTQLEQHTEISSIGIEDAQIVERAE